MTEEIKTEETQEETEKTAEPATEEKPLDKMTAPELREIAKAIPGVTGTSALKKDELLKIIKEHRGIKDEEPKKKKTSPKKPLDVKTLKAKVVALRAEKKKAQEAKDKKQINVLRCRINRLKKKTRRVAKG